MRYTCWARCCSRPNERIKVADRDLRDRNGRIRTFNHWLIRPLHNRCASFRFLCGLRSPRPAHHRIWPEPRVNAQLTGHGIFALSPASERQDLNLHPYWISFYCALPLSYVPMCPRPLSWPASFQGGARYPSFQSSVYSELPSRGLSSAPLGHGFLHLHPCELFAGEILFHFSFPGQGFEPCISFQ